MSILFVNFFLLQFTVWAHVPSTYHKVKTWRFFLNFVQIFLFALFFVIYDGFHPFQRIMDVNSFFIPGNKIFSYGVLRYSKYIFGLQKKRNELVFNKLHWN